MQVFEVNVSSANVKQNGGMPGVMSIAVLLTLQTALLTSNILYLDVTLMGYGSAEDIVVEGVRYSCYLQLHATAIMTLALFTEENRRGSV